MPQRDSSDDEEAKATRKERLFKMPGKKATIRLHAKLGPQAVYRKKESGAISSDGHNEKLVNKRDIVTSGGDYDDGASFANDYGDTAAHESPARFGDGHQNKSAFKPRSEQFAAPLRKDDRRFKRGGSGHAAKKAQSAGLGYSGSGQESCEYISNSSGQYDEPPRYGRRTGPRGSRANKCNSTQ